MDAFISWTSADRDVKNALMEKLRGVDIDCWDSDEECVSDYSTECIQNIRRSELFIVIVSDASMAKGYVINEIIEARKQEGEGKLNILVYKITDSPLTDQFTCQLNHISQVSGNLIQRRETLGEESSMDKIVRRAVKLLTARKEGNPEKPYDVHTPKLSGLSVTATGYFVENSREDILQAMDAGFQRSNVLVMREFFGFGKRATIRKYVEMHRAAIKNAVFIRNTQGKLRSFLLTELNFSNLNPGCFDGLEGDALIDAKLHFLERLDESNLLIISDVDCSEPLDENLCQQLLSLKCRIILLTQDATDSYDDWFPVIRVGRMENEYLTELFFHHYTRAAEEDREALTVPLVQFFDRIGGHTKTVELTASVLRRDIGALPEEVASYLSLDGGEGMQLQDRILEQIAKVFDLAQPSREQGIALLAAACLAVPDISERNYRQILRQCGVTDHQTLIELEQRGWLDLDMQNQTVSMEPLVAQIVFRKFCHETGVLIACEQYIQELNARSLMAPALPLYFRALSKYEYFCRLVGLPLLGQAVALLRLRGAEEKKFVPEDMAQVVQQIEEAYPASRYGGAEPEEEDFISGMIRFFRSYYLPNCKIFASNAGQLLFNYAYSNDLTAQLPMQVFDMEAAFGMTEEELREWIVSLREQADQFSDMDAEEWEAVFLIESVNVMDALFTRNIAEIQMGMSRLLDYLFATPEILQSEDSKQVFISVVTMLSAAYTASGAYSSVVMLCERVIEAFQDMEVPPRLRDIYGGALRATKAYSDALYDNYEKLLECYETEGDKYFESRQELRRHKSILLLQYAHDLAMSGQFAAAIEKFAKAQKLGCTDLLENTIRAAENITQMQINDGDFDGANTFVKKYITPELLRQAEESENDELREKAATLHSILQLEKADEEKGESPLQYLSYYQEFPRKNNSVLDRKYFTVADRAMQFDFSGLSDIQIAQHAEALRTQAATKNILELAPEAFALVSEAGYRVLGYRHHYVQYMAAAVMADGKIAEVLNGEGKTYAIVLTAFLCSLYGGRVFVVDESAYLTERNYNWMKGVYALLGIDTFLAVEALSLEGKNPRVCYATLKQLAVGYMNAELYAKERWEMNMACVIIDEADIVLADQAKQAFTLVATQKIDYAETERWLQLYRKIWKLMPLLENKKNYYDYRKGNVTLSPEMYPLLENYFGMDWMDIANLETIRKLEWMLRCAIIVAFYYKEGKDYFIHNGRPYFEDKAKGVFSDFRTEYDFYLCLKHDLPTTVAEHNFRNPTKTNNIISVRDLLRKAVRLCGTTATAANFQKEFKEIYGLEYVAVPPHKPCIRRENPTVLYMTRQRKMSAILELVLEKNDLGQPVLLCTQSVEESEDYSKALSYIGISHKLLNAKNAVDTANILAFAGMPCSVLVANALAGRGADIKLGGDPERITRRELVERGVDITGLEELLYARPTEEMKQSLLYKRYFSILEKNRRICAKNRQQVCAVGGLCVLTTSFFPEARNEQQAIGRAGRQGDPGESYVFRSMDDDTLNVLLGSAPINWIRNACGDQDLPEPKMLRNAIRNAQKALHNNHFARVREYNNTSSYVDEARPILIGKRMDLREGKLTYEELLKQWAADKQVLAQLQELQKGAESCENTVLMRLWKQSEELQQAKGWRSAKVLNEVLQELLSKVSYMQRAIDNTMEYYFCDCWNQYIKLTEDLVNYTNMEGVTLRKYIQQERQRLEQKITEHLIRTLLTLRERFVAE